MTVLVAIPYYGVPELVGRAVRSVLAQTHRDLVCLVIGDGDDPPLAGEIADPRLRVWRLARNRGTYFGLQLALLASPHRWFAPHAADDWSDPGHLEQLLAVAGADGDAVITGAVWWEQAGRTTVHEARYEVGLFARDRLLAIGGYNPAERMGQDSLLIRLLDATGPLRATHSPTYHRVRRPGSLTTSSETGLRTLARRQMRRRNRAILAESIRLRRPSSIAAYRTSLVPRPLARELEREVRRLRAVLG